MLLPATSASNVTSRKVSAPVLSPSDAIQLGERKYTDIRATCLAIFAEPHAIELTDPAAKAKAGAIDLLVTSAHSKAFEAGVPSCRVIRLPHADHAVYFSNEADVLREVTAFIDGLQ